MTYLNEKDRENLLNELIQLPFLKAKNKARRLDPKAIMEVYRNVQHNGEWLTRYRLPTRGTIVTLIESYNNPDNDPNSRQKAKFELEKVIVEPMPENRT